MMEAIISGTSITQGTNEASFNDSCVGSYQFLMFQRLRGKGIAELTFNAGSAGQTAAGADGGSHTQWTTDFGGMPTSKVARVTIEYGANDSPGTAFRASLSSIVAQARAAYPGVPIDVHEMLPRNTWDYTAINADIAAAAASVSPPANVLRMSTLPVCGHYAGTSIHPDAQGTAQAAMLAADLQYAIRFPPTPPARKTRFRIGA